MRKYRILNGKIKRANKSRHCKFWGRCRCAWCRPQHNIAKQKAKANYESSSAEDWPIEREAWDSPLTAIKL